MKRLLLLLSVLPLMAFSLGIKPDARLRVRFVQMNNKDQDSSRAADFHLIDMRGRLGIKLTDKNSPFYFYYKLEVGNLGWGEPLVGSSLGNDGVNLETKNLYIGYKKQGFRGKIGLIPFGTPLGAAFDNDLAGLKITYKTKLWHATVLYSLAAAGTNSLALNDPIDAFEANNGDDAQIYYVNGGLKVKANTFDAWLLRFDDKRWGDQRLLNYIGIYDVLKIGVFSLKVGGVYNTGSVIQSNNTLAVGALHLYSYAKVKLPQIADLFLRLNITTGNGGDTNLSKISQFQVIEGQGRMHSDLGILFGGDSFSQQAFFDHRAPVSDTKKNLTEGALQNNDYGLFVIECGLSREIKALKWTPSLVAGYASTLATVNGHSMLGLELDWHNRFKLNKNTALKLSAAFLLPGAALTDVIDKTYPGIKISTLGSDPTLKIDGKIEIRL